MGARRASVSAAFNGSARRKDKDARKDARTVVEYLMCPLLEATFGAPGTKNPQTHGARDLERRNAHTATCAVHQCGISRQDRPHL